MWYFYDRLHLLWTTYAHFWYPQCTANMCPFCSTSVKEWHKLTTHLSLQLQVSTHTHTHTHLSNQMLSTWKQRWYKENKTTLDQKIHLYAIIFNEIKQLMSLRICVSIIIITHCICIIHTLYSSLLLHVLDKEYT